MIRVVRDGYRPQELGVSARSAEGRLRIDLEPLPNVLVAFSHVVLAGRGHLVLLTREAATFRLQSSERKIGIVLLETSLADDARHMIESADSALVAQATGRQLAGDLLVQVSLRRPTRELDVRWRQWRDAARGLHAFALDLVPREGEAVGVQTAQAALSRMRVDDVRGCALEFDAALHQRLDTAALSRALSPNGSHRDRVLRAVMRRLGELSAGGAIEMRDGTPLRSSEALELTAASMQPGDAIGFLALLRRFVSETESERFRAATYRGIVAPELRAEQFEVLMTQAVQRELACRATARSGSAGR